jgi:tetratricopeptide (TPR) repeat protein
MMFMACGGKSMDAITFFSWTYKYYGYYKTFTGIFATQLSDFLASVGDSQYRAALNHLENAKEVTGQDRREQYVLAVGALESATQLYLDSVPRGFKAFASAVSGGHGEAMGYLGAAETATLAATCYKNMGNPKLAKKYILRAKEYFDQYVPAELQYQQRTKVWNNGGVPAPRINELNREKERIKEEAKTFNKVLSKAGVK